MEQINKTSGLATDAPREFSVAELTERIKILEEGLMALADVLTDEQQEQFNASWRRRQSALR